MTGVQTCALPIYKLLDGGEEVIGDCVFKRSVKSLLSLSLLDSFFSFITLSYLLFSYRNLIRVNSKVRVEEYLRITIQICLL